MLVIFGTEDARYPSSSAAAYRVVPGARVELLPGVGHTPMMEDPQTTAHCCWSSPQPPATAADRFLRLTEFVRITEALPPDGQVVVRSPQRRVRHWISQ